MIIDIRKLQMDTKSTVKTAMIFERFSAKVIDKLTNSVFISHKHTDFEIVSRVKDLLEKCGFIGYVDWEDDLMPPTTSGETAIKIKEKISEAKKFIFIATNQAIESKWCNWEIGYADAFKYINNIAIMPIEQANDSFKGEEYLNIYPSIQIESNDVEKPSKYYVLFPDKRKITLRDWLTI